MTPALASSALNVVPTETLSKTASTATLRPSTGAPSAPSRASAGVPPDTPARIICSFSGIPSFS